MRRMLAKAISALLVLVLLMQCAVLSAWADEGTVQDCEASGTGHDWSNKNGICANCNAGHECKEWKENGACATCGKVKGCSHTNSENRAAVPAYCNAEGLTAGVYCKDCEKYISGGETVPMDSANHPADKIVTDAGFAANCTDAGKTTGSHCSACNATITAQTDIPATGHSEVIDAAVAATCTAAGKTEGKHCSICGEVIAAQAEIPAKGHTVVIDPAMDSSCTVNGLSEGKHCSICGEVIAAQAEIPAKGHSIVTIAAVAATCTKSGLTEGEKCSVCGEVLAAQTEVSAKGHKRITIAAVEATCTSMGLTEGKKCSVCGAVMQKQKATPLASHEYEVSYAQGSSTITITCKNCGKRMQSSIDGDMHAAEYAEQFGLTNFDEQQQLYAGMYSNGLLSLTAYAQLCGEDYMLLILQHYGNPGDENIVGEALRRYSQDIQNNGKSFFTKADKTEIISGNRLLQNYQLDYLLRMSEQSGGATREYFDMKSQPDAEPEDKTIIIGQGQYQLHISGNLHPNKSGGGAGDNHLLVSGSIRVQEGSSKTAANQPSDSTPTVTTNSNNSGVGDNHLLVSGSIRTQKTGGEAQEKQMPESTQIFTTTTDDGSITMLDIQENGEKTKFTSIGLSTGEDGKSQLTMESESGVSYIYGEITEETKQAIDEESKEADIIKLDGKTGKDMSAPNASSEPTATPNPSTIYTGERSGQDELFSVSDYEELQRLLDEYRQNGNEKLAELLAAELAKLPGGEKAFDCQYIIFSDGNGESYVVRRNTCSSGSGTTAESNTSVALEYDKDFVFEMNSSSLPAGSDTAAASPSPSPSASPSASSSTSSTSNSGRLMGMEYIMSTDHRDLTSDILDTRIDDESDEMTRDKLADLMTQHGPGAEEGSKNGLDENKGARNYGNSDAYVNASEITNRILNGSTNIGNHLDESSDGNLQFDAEDREALRDLIMRYQTSGDTEDLQQLQNDMQQELGQSIAEGDDDRTLFLLSIMGEARIIDDDGTSLDTGMTSIGSSGVGNSSIGIRRSPSGMILDLSSN